MATKSECCQISSAHCTSYVGAIFLAIGIIFAATYKPILNFGLTLVFQLKEGSLYFDQFIQPEPPIYLSIYIWDVQNYDDYTYNTRTNSWTFPKPVMKEVGPFVYREIRIKENVTYTDSTTKTRLQARQTYFYESVYDPDLSWTGLDPMNHRVSVTNILAVGLPSIVEHALRNRTEILKTAGRLLVNDVLKTSEALPIIKDITADDAIFHYKDPVLIALHEICQHNQICKEIEFIQHILEVLPSEFGMLVQKILPLLGWPYYEWNTGIPDIENYAQIMRYKMVDRNEFNSELLWWPEGTSCNLIKGTDGMSQQPFLRKEVDTAWIFSPDAYRSLYLNYTGISKTKNYGVKTYRYELDIETIFAGPNNNPENACYCYGNWFWDERNHGLDCNEMDGGYIPDAAWFGVPLLLTFPHFTAGEKWRNLARGEYFPNKTNPNYQTFMESEPISGASMKVASRLQQNLAITKDKHGCTKHGHRESSGSIHVFCLKNMVMKKIFISHFMALFSKVFR